MPVAMPNDKVTWQEVLRRIGVDAVATVVYLYFDDLASRVGKCAEDYDDPALIMKELEGEDGTVDGNILNCAEKTAWARFRYEYRWRLPEPDGGAVSDLIWSLVC
jgi:hypothetical protein